MDDESARRQHSALSYPYLGQFTDALTINSQAALDADMDAVWRPFELQIPQCIGPDNTVDCFRTSHDDLCAYPPKCPTTNLLGSGTSASSHMLFHTRHYPSQAALHHTVSAQRAAGLSIFQTASSGGAYASTSTSIPFGYTTSCPSATSGSGYNCFDHDDFVDQLSALSSPLHNPIQDVDCDTQSICDSACGDGEICHDSICSDDPSACCEDESCLQTVPSAVIDGAPLTTEDAIAVAALASFVDQSTQQQQQQQQELQPEQEQQQSLIASPPIHSHHHLSPSSGLEFVMGPDLCISPQFLTNYRHLREAHNPLQPTSCRASFCPIDDPSFYAECHIKHVIPQDQANYFDNINLNMILGADSSLGVAYECGAKFPNGEAMVEHFWNEHRVRMPDYQQQPPINAILGHVPGMASNVSVSSQDLIQTPTTVTSMEPPSLVLPGDSSPLLDAKYSYGPNAQTGEARPETQCPQLLPDQEAKETKQLPQKYECFWCDSIGGSPCGQLFDSTSDLHKHAIETHTHLLKRDVGGTYSCGWLGCNRRDCAEKGGFAQKSKIDRHMQVHTGNKPFLCGICGQSFSANQALVQHKLIHADIKPLACEICGKTFRQHSALTMHTRTHTKIRPLKCPFCCKEFSESSNLSKHKRIHTGEGLYICHSPGCGKHFHRKDQLRRHSTQHSKGRGEIQTLAALVETV